MNMNNLAFRTFLMITVVFILAFFSACEKKASITPNKNVVAEEIVSFANTEEYTKTLDMILAMNEEELKNYEESKGLKSFGRTSEEFYRNIQIDEFKSIDEIKSFVRANSNFLQLIEDENGELELETKYYNRADRYFLNKYNMYQIGDLVYKVFEAGTVIGSSEDIEILKQAGNNIDSYMQDARFKFVPNKENSTTNYKSSLGACGTSHTFRSTNGANRLKVNISVNAPTTSHLKCDFLARPYKRTLGIWFWCTRTMKADIDLRFRYYDYCPGSTSCYMTYDGSLIFYQDWVSSSKFEKIVNISGQWILTGGDEEPCFTSYDVWADTYSVSPVIAVCN